MIYFSDNEFKFWTLSVTFTSSEDGEQQAYCNDNNKTLYEEMAKNYSWKFSNMKFNSVEPTEEQKTRLEVLNTIEAEHKNLYENECVLFVEHGAILPDTKSEFLVTLRTEYATPTQAYIDSNIKLKLWYKIKTERDRRIHEGGYKVVVDGVDKWFHSDTFSRSQQIGLVMIGTNVPQGLMWKTMDGSFVEMTPSLAQQVFTSATVSDSTIFSHAEYLRGLVNASDDPESIDILSGWPECYLDIE